MVTVLVLLISYPLADHLANNRDLRFTRRLFCIVVPYFTSIIVRTYSWMVLLGRNGIINQVLLYLGHRRAADAALHQDGRADRHGLRAAALHGPDAVRDDEGDHLQPDARRAAWAPAVSTHSPGLLSAVLCTAWCPAR